MILNNILYLFNYKGFSILFYRMKYKKLKIIEIFFFFLSKVIIIISFSFYIIILKIYLFNKNITLKKRSFQYYLIILSEKNEKKTNSQLIRIEGFIREEKQDEVLAALNKLGIPATFYESKGIGKGEKYQIRYGRHGDILTMPYSNRRTVETIVTEDKVEEVVSIIKDSAKIDKTGGAGGIIVISKVDEIISI